jgi:hypothetical protein
LADQHLVVARECAVVASKCEIARAASVGF